MLIFYCNNIYFQSNVYFVGKTSILHLPRLAELAAVFTI